MHILLYVGEIQAFVNYAKMMMARIGLAVITVANTSMQVALMSTLKQLCQTTLFVHEMLCSVHRVKYLPWA